MVAEAKARFGEVIDRAFRHGPRAITRNGRRGAVSVATLAEICFRDWAAGAGAAPSGVSRLASRWQAEMPP